MAPSRQTDRRTQRGLERVRDQILTALHFGKLGPGDRAPSVRRLADLTGMNRKTVHRAYRRLAREGLLDLRPGSGTFIAEKNGRANGDPSTRDLIGAINRCRAEANRLGVPPRVFSEFLNNYLGKGLQDVPVAVVECNLEQVGMIVQDLQAGLGVQVRPVLLSELATSARRLASTMGIVTTDCHWNEVVETVGGLNLPVYRIALDAAFPQTLAHHAKHGPVLMIVRDAAFAPVFLRLLRQLSVPEEQVERFTFVEVDGAREALRRSEPATTVYVSPMLDSSVGLHLPKHVRRIQCRWHIAPGSVDRLRARMALDAALRARRST